MYGTAYIEQSRWTLDKLGEGSENRTRAGYRAKVLPAEVPLALKVREEQGLIMVAVSIPATGCKFDTTRRLGLVGY